MTMKYHFCLGSLLLSLPSCGVHEEAEKKAPEHPNIILIMSDDLCPRLGCYGDDMARTPSIDRLAGRGVLFRRAYCQLPTCGPSRASMLTGLYPWQTGVYAGEPLRGARPEMVTFPQLLREHGYFTARAGKIYHIGIPGGIGSAGADDPFSWDLAMNNDGWDGKRENLQKVHRIADIGLGIVPAWLAAPVRDEEMADGQGTAGAIRIMEAFHPSKTGKPLMLAVGYYRPHPPMVAPEKYFDLHPVDSVELPVMPENDRADIPEVAFELKSEAFNFIPEPDAKQYTRAYYAAVSFMDRQVGKLMDALEENGLLENSVIVFVGDQGFHLGEHGHWHKTTLFEEGCRVPLIISAPGMQKAGGTSGVITELVDVFPTLCEILGIDPPAELPGKSLVPVLQDTDTQMEATALTRVRQANGISMRTGRYRFTSWNVEGEGIYELYDHRTDPHEYHNLAAGPGCENVLQEMKALLEEKYTPEILYKKDKQ